MFREIKGRVTGGEGRVADLKFSVGGDTDESRRTSKGRRKISENVGTPMISDGSRR